MQGTFNLLKGVIPFTKYPYVGVSDPCSVCGGAKKATVCEYDRRIKRLTTVICDDCGTLRTDPMPTDAELANYYATAYRFDYQLSAGNKPPKFHLKRSRGLAEHRFAKYSPAFPEGGRVLDFGCGSGEFLKVCKENGHEVEGIEPGESYARFANETYGVQVQNCGWQDADFGDRTFDVITAFHVFEHLRDPKAALQFLLSKLNEGGVIVIEVPNMLPSKKKLFEELHFAHVYGFTPNTLERLGNECGLERHPMQDHPWTDMVFRRADGEIAPGAANSDYSRDLAGQYDKTDIAAFLLKFGWLGDMYRRVAKDLRDSR